MSRTSLSLGVSLTCLLFAGTAHGQVQRQLGTDNVKLEEAFKLYATRSSQLKDAMEMKVKPPPPDILDKVAKYYVYRITWVNVVDAKAPEKGDPEIVKHVNEFNRHIKQVLDFKANPGNDDPTFVNAYAPVLVSAFSEVTDLPPIENAKAIVHLTHMMPALAKLQHDSVSKYLVGLLDSKSNKHDYIKLGAIRALREFMPVDAWGDILPFDLQNKRRLAHKAGDLERIEALTKFILRPAPPTSAAPDEVEAFRYLRREAIETLAMAGAPAVAASKVGGKGQPVEGPIAPLLVRICMGKDAGNDQLVPEPSFAERNEAALGLCNMVTWHRPNPNGALAPKIVEAFDPNPTYYFIGKTFLECAREYSADFAAGGGKLGWNMPWSYVGKRWELALDRLAKNAPPNDKKAIAAAAAIQKDALPLAKAIQQMKVNVNNFPAIADPTSAPPQMFQLFRPPVESPQLKWNGAN